MTQYAVVQNSSVINVILWDGKETYEPGTGNTLVAIPSGQNVSAGYSYASGVFTPPAVSAPPAPTLAQQAAAAINAGLAITSTGTPALDGTYTVASGVPFGREDIGTEAQFVSTFSEFTNGAQTLEWPMADGTFVAFPSTAAFLNFAKAAAQFYAAAKAVAALNSGTLPSASATIP